jgi:ferredoxin
MSEFVQEKIGDLTIRIDRETCIGSANCIKAAPEVFELDSEKICAFKEGRGAVEREVVIEACRVCPVDALYVIDPAGQQLVP